jgi:hypothetical protein
MAAPLRGVASKGLFMLRPILLGSSVVLATATLSLAQCYDPDLGQGNTAPPGITYGGGLRYGSGISSRMATLQSHAGLQRLGAPHGRHHRNR